jgi:hypothetical protein
MKRQIKPYEWLNHGRAWNLTLEIDGFAEFLDPVLPLYKPFHQSQTNLEIL